jgi:hypothetical protein
VTPERTIDVDAVASAPRPFGSALFAALRVYFVHLLFWLPSLVLAVAAGKLEKTYREFSMVLPWITTLVLDYRVLLFLAVLMAMVVDAVVLFALNASGSRRGARVAWSAAMIAAGLCLAISIALAALLPMIKLLEGLDR